MESGRHLREVPKKLGADLTQFNGEVSWTLPMPARYVIAQDGTIAYADVNADITRQPEPSATRRPAGAICRPRRSQQPSDFSDIVVQSSAIASDVRSDFLLGRSPAGLEHSLEYPLQEIGLPRNAAGSHRTGTSDPERSFCDDGLALRSGETHEL